MDQLLSRAPQALTNERKELFALAERFLGTIGAYRKQYADTLAAKNKDLEDRKKSAQEAALRQAAESQNRLSTMQGAHDREIRTFQDKIGAERDAVRKQLEALDAGVEEFTSAKRKEALDEYTKGKNHIDDLKETERRLREIYESTDEGLSTTITGKRRIEKILDGEDIDVSVYSEKSAEEALNEDRVTEAKEAAAEISRIMEKYSRRVFLHLRRNRNVICVAENFQRAENAVNFLEKNLAAQTKANKDETEKQIAAKRKKANLEKERLIQARDSRIAKIQSEIQVSEASFRNSYASTQAQEAKKQQTAKASAANGLQTAEADWNRKIEEYSRKFTAHMDAEYPADRMTAWMKCFWNHPKKIEDYGKLKAMQLNIQTGIAEFDISGFYKGENAAVIRNVLKKYPILFYGGVLKPEDAYKKGILVFPFLVSLEDGDSLLISYPDQKEETAKAMVNLQGMRMLRSVGAGSMRFELFDAVGVGGFGELLKLDPSKKNNPNEPNVKSFAIGENGSVHAADIRQQIDETRIRMDDLSIQLTSYPSLRVYNEKNPLSRQNYSPVLMLNFPAGLDEGGLMTLNTMAVNCRRWGFSMVLAQPDKELNAVRPELRRYVDEIHKNAVCLRMNDSDNTFRIQNPGSQVEKAVVIRLYGGSSAAVMEQVAREIRSECVSAGSRKLYFNKAVGVCPNRNELFSGKADRGIAVPIGYVGGTPLSLQFDDDHVHAMIMGNTGSGKTNLLHVLITNTMLRYSPQEVKIYLIDFKHGLDFSVYTNYNLPSFGSINIANEPGFALAMLEHLGEEEQRRSLKLQGNYNKISTYNLQNPEKKMPRVLLIVDELYEMVQSAPQDLQERILYLVNSFVHQWRAFGFHVIVSGQDLDKLSYFETIKNQCATRIAMNSDDEQVKALMSADSVSRMHLIDSSEKGSCVISLTGGSNPIIEHTALMELDLVKQYLQYTGKYYLDRKQITDVKVFHTNASSDPNCPVQMFVTNGYLPEPDHHRMYVGESYSFEHDLDLRPQGNVWVIGGDRGNASGKAAHSLMLFMLISVIMEKLKAGNVRIYCTNCANMQLRSREETENDRFSQLAANLPQLCSFSDRTGFRKTLDELLDELDRRQSGTSSSKEDIWWFVSEPELVETGMDTAQTVSDLKLLLQKGPGCRIHTVLFNGSAAGAQKLTLSHMLFGDRLCLEMAKPELQQVNGVDIPVQPSGSNAVLVSEAGLTKFRVYDIPDGTWLQLLCDRLKQAQA